MCDRSKLAGWLVEGERADLREQFVTLARWEGGDEADRVDSFNQALSGEAVKVWEVFSFEWCEAGRCREGRAPGLV